MGALSEQHRTLCCGDPASVRKTKDPTPAGELLAVDDLSFEVRRSSRRYTLEITIDRGGDLILAAPVQASTRIMREFVREKRGWIYGKLIQKSLLRRPAPSKEFVTGEGFHYLGRSYRLLLVDAQERPLKLGGGRFRLVRSEATRGRFHFLRWYADHGRAWLLRRVEQWAPWVGVAPTGVRVLDLGHRWGSCGRAGTLNFHRAVILLPPNVAEYVVVHELVHLREPGHTRGFWRRVERVLPDYERRKAWLAEHGAAHSDI